MSENNTLIDMAVVVGYDEVKSLLNIKFMCKECEQEYSYAFYLYEKKEGKAIMKLPYTKKNSVTIEAPNEEILKYLNRSDDVMNLLSILDKTYAKKEFTLEM
jgi:hypothetical protein